MNRGVMRLSTTLDCWKKSCHGATVVPTMAMMSSTAADEAPPAMPGTMKLWPMVPAMRIREEEDRHLNAGRCR